MEENKIWANLNDSYNLDIIITENQSLKNYVPKREYVKKDTRKSDINQSMEEIVKEILSSDYKLNNILQILAKQNNVGSYLIKTFRSSRPEDIIWEKFRPGLNWILESSKFITSKTSTFIQQFKTDKIYRSSYKFCNKKDECDALYCHITKPGQPSHAKCNGDHYVHNKLVSDLSCLIGILDTRKEDGEISSISNDLRICLDTVNFVINHMNQELNNFNIYYSKQEGFDINKFYVTSIPKRSSRV
jgi:hypothetical protein